MDTIAAVTCYASRNPNNFHVKFRPVTMDLRVLIYTGRVKAHTQ